MTPLGALHKILNSVFCPGAENSAIESESIFVKLMQIAEELFECV